MVTKIRKQGHNFQFQKWQKVYKRNGTDLQGVEGQIRGCSYNQRKLNRSLTTGHCFRFRRNTQEDSPINSTRCKTMLKRGTWTQYMRLQMKQHCKLLSSFVLFKPLSLTLSYKFKLQTVHNMVHNWQKQQQYTPWCEGRSEVWTDAEAVGAWGAVMMTTLAGCSRLSTMHMWMLNSTRLGQLLKHTLHMKLLSPSFCMAWRYSAGFPWLIWGKQVKIAWTWLQT